MKTKSKIIASVLCLALAGSVMAGCGKGDKTVSTDGSTSMEKVIGALGEQFKADNEGVTFTYNATGSSTGITAVSEGRCDIGLSSRALKDEEKSSGLKETILAYDGIAVIVNTENEIDGLSLDDIAKIYTGEIKNWSELAAQTQISSLSAGKPEAERETALNP